MNSHILKSATDFSPNDQPDTAVASIRPAMPAYKLADDLLRSAQEIADFLGWTRRRVYHVRATDKYFPVFSMAGQLYARKSTLIFWIESQERGDTPATTLELIAKRDGTDKLGGDQ